MPELHLPFLFGKTSPLVNWKSWQSRIFGFISSSNPCYGANPASVIREHNWSQECLLLESPGKLATYPNFFYLQSALDCRFLHF